MKSFKELKGVIAENRYMVKFEKGGSMKLREYEASSAMAAESKAKVDAQRMGMTVASVRLKEVEKKTKDSPAMDEAHQEVSADVKVTASGKKVPAQRKQVHDDEDDKGEIKEAVTVKKANYSWGKMVTVHHGSENSYPLHPEHQAAIKKLKDDESTSFKDETNRKVTAHRQGETIHLSGAGSNKRTAVARSHFTESVNEEMGTHRVSVTVTDPHHPATTMRNKKYEKRVKVKARDREHAIDSALHFYKKQGLKVHDHNYIGTVNESVKTTHENPLVTVHDMHGLHTHANLSTANHIFNTKVKYNDVHKGQVKTKSGHDDGRDLTFAISQHHAKSMKENVNLDEAMDKEETRLIQLARLGLVDKSNVSKLRMAMEQLKSDKPLSVVQRNLLLNVLEDLFSLVTGDDQVFMRLKRDVQKESVEELDENTEALKKKADASGISLSTLKTVYRRGVAAWNSGHRPGTTPQQWGMARVNSYVTKGKGTYHGADKDLREGGEPGEFNVNDIDEACWDTHKQVGMKKKGDRMVPNCVPKNEEVQEDSRLDNKAYHKGVSDKTAQARVSHWKKMDKLSDRDPKAYQPAPGDATAKTTPSKHTKKYHAMYGEQVNNTEEDSIVDEGYVSLAQQRAVWATRKDGGKGHPDYKKKTAKEQTDPPFDGPYTKVQPDVVDKSGAKHTAMSRVKHLAKLALQKQQQKNKKSAS